MRDYYKVLQINVNASEIDIKKAFRKKALLTHPDKTNRDSSQEFLDIYEAYSILSDQRKRAKYDKLYKNSQNELDTINIDPDFDLVSISRKGKIYANSYHKFNREFYSLILLELFLGIDRLLYAATICLFLGFWTMIIGIMGFNIVESLLGLGLVLLGFYFAVLKINRLDY